MSQYKLDEPHQYLLQIFLNRGVLDQKAFHQVFKGLMDKYAMARDESRDLKLYYEPFLRTINHVIIHFNLEISKGACEITGLPFFCLIRQCDTASIGKLSQLYTPVELKIFRIILAAIIESEEGSVDYATLVNQIADDYVQISNDLATQSQSTRVPTNKEIRLIIQKFMNDYWLIEVYDQENTIALHGRAIMELSSYIKDSYGDQIKTCLFCKSILLCGPACEKCEGQMHRHCAQQVLKSQKKCPVATCRAPFRDDTIQQINEQISEARERYAAKATSK